MNPTLQAFLEINPDITMNGFAWALLWRFAVFSLWFNIFILFVVVAVWYGIAYIAKQLKL